VHMEGIRPFRFKIKCYANVLKIVTTRYALDFISGCYLAIPPINLSVFEMTSIEETGDAIFTNARVDFLNYN
jgi:hypothetical protein